MEENNKKEARIFVRKNAKYLAKKIADGESEVIFDESTYTKGSEKYISVLLMTLPYVQSISLMEDGKIYIRLLN